MKNSKNDFIVYYENGKFIIFREYDSWFIRYRTTQLVLTTILSQLEILPSFRIVAGVLDRSMFWREWSIQIMWLSTALQLDFKI